MRCGRMISLREGILVDEGVCGSAQEGSVRKKSPAQLQREIDAALMSDETKLAN